MTLRKENVRAADLRALARIIADLARGEDMAGLQSRAARLIAKINNRNRMSILAAFDYRYASRTRTCSLCEEEKDIAHFEVRRVRNDGGIYYSRRCRECARRRQAELCRQNYARHKVAIQAKRRANRAKRREELRLCQ